MTDVKFERPLWWDLADSDSRELITRALLKAFHMKMYYWKKVLHTLVIIALYITFVEMLLILKIVPQLWHAKPIIRVHYVRAIAWKYTFLKIVYMYILFRMVAYNPLEHRSFYKVIAYGRIKIKLKLINWAT